MTYEPQEGCEPMLYNYKWKNLPTGFKCVIIIGTPIVIALYCILL